MKLLKSLIFALLLSAPGLFAQSVVQTCSNGTYASNPTAACVMGSNVTTGNYVVFYAVQAGGLTLGTPSTSGTATVGSWSVIGTPAQNSEMWIASVTGTGSLTVTGSATGGFNWLGVIGKEATGVSATTDGSAYKNESSCSTCNTTSITTTVDGDLVLAFVERNGNLSTSMSSPFSPNDVGPSYYSSPSITMAGGNDKQTTHGSIHATYTDAGAGGKDSIVALEANLTVNNPSFSPTSGTGQNNTMTLSVSTSGGAKLCYNLCTTNGCTPTTPAASTPGTCSNGTTLTTSAGVGTISGITGPYYTISVLGTESGYTNSNVTTANYTFTGATPSSSLPSSPNFNQHLPQTPTITWAGGAPTGCYGFNITPATNRSSGCSTGSLISSGSTATLLPGTNTLNVIAGGTGYLDGSVSSTAYTVTPTVAAWNGLKPWSLVGTLKSFNTKTLGSASGNINAIDRISSPTTPDSVTTFTDFRGGTPGGTPANTDLVNSIWGTGATWNTSQILAGFTYSTALAVGNLPGSVTSNDGTTHIASGTNDILCTTGVSTHCGAFQQLLGSSSPVASLGFWFQSNCSGATQDCAAHSGLYWGTDYTVIHVNPGPGPGQPCPYSGLYLENAIGGNPRSCLPYSSGTIYRVNFLASQGQSPFTATFSNSSPSIVATQTLAANQSVQLSTASGTFPSGGGYSSQGVLWTGTYTSGITATGATNQTCLLTGFNGGGSGATGTVLLAGTNTIAGGTAISFVPPGSGFTSAPTSATASSGTATCSGTATISSTISTGQTYYVLSSGLSGSAFQLALTQGGAALQPTSAGSGTLTLTLVNQMTVCSYLQPGIVKLLGNLTAVTDPAGSAVNEYAIGPVGEEPYMNGFTFHYGGYVYDSTGKFSSTGCF